MIRIRRRLCGPLPPAGIRMTIELECDRCGGCSLLELPATPATLDAMVAHLRDECHDEDFRPLPLVDEHGRPAGMGDICIGCVAEFRDASVNFRDPKGGDPDEWPEDLRIREFPR